MKKSSKIPVWPIYVADALMFAAVFAVALPNLYTGEPLGIATVFMCSLMVLGGLLLCLAPFYMGLKNAALEEKASAEAKVQDDLRIIFDELAALRMMITDIEEREETYPARLEALEHNSEKSADAVTRAEVAELAGDIREAVKSKLGEFRDSLDSLAAETQQCRSGQKDADKIVAELCSDITIIKDLLPASSESLTDEIYALKSRLENVEDSLKSVSEDTVVEDEPADGDDDEIADEQQFDNSAKQAEGMLGRALAASENSKDSVGKFITLAKPESQSETQGQEEKEPASLDSVKAEFEKIAADIAFENGGESEAEIQENSVEEIVSEKQSQEPNQEQLIAPSSEESANEPQQQNSSPSLQNEFIEPTPPQIPQSETRKDDADFFESSDSLSGLGESQKEKPEAPKLFELPELLAKAPKPKKGDTAITVNALIGIGNKPFLRGNGGGLNRDKGVAMEYVEIGKWRYIFPEIETPVEFAVYKNDDVQSDGLQNFKISPNERLYLNLSFPL